MIEHVEREKIKSHAWSVVGNEEYSIESRARALLKIIEMHYWRAREGLQGRPVSALKKIYGKRYCKGYKLDIDVYTRHWMHANRNNIGSRHPEEMEYICKKLGYEPEASRYLPDGMTCYYIGVMD